MPELPEVYTIVKDLQKFLPRLKITDVWTDAPNLIRTPKPFAKFRKQIIGETILGVEQKGKNILIRLSHPSTSLGTSKILLVHQKMTGHLLYGTWYEEQGTWKSKEPGPLRDDPENRFIHVMFSLPGKHQLALCDMRKFAKVALFPVDETSKIDDIQKLGPEPFDKKFTLKLFSEILKNKTGKIKIVLMDQSVIAGIGNIYSDEILWQAGIHPLKKVSSLSEKEIKDIYTAIKPILKKAIKARGSSYIDYRDALGRKGNYQTMHLAYQMDGTKCKKRDGGILEKIKIGGRSAHFCPVHQKL